jgi:hypothetical protein
MGGARTPSIPFGVSTGLATSLGAAAGNWTCDASGCGVLAGFAEVWGGGVGFGAADASVADVGVGVAGVGVGGGGIEPFGGPYCSMGRKEVGGGAGGFESFTAYMVASKA